jgi:hypothetical protein
MRVAVPHTLQSVEVPLGVVILVVAYGTAFGACSNAVGETPARVSASARYRKKSLQSNVTVLHFAR